MTSPAVFLFASEDGTVSGWSSSLPSTTNAFVMIDDSASSANYKAITVSSDRLYLADFHNARVVVYDDQLIELTLAAGAFAAPAGASGYAPFGIQAIGNEIFVAWAQRDPSTDDEVAGAGKGFVEVYDRNGTLVAEVAANGELNAAWGIAMAPSSFGAHSDELLVGNFGDGRIIVFSRSGNTFTPRGHLLLRGGGAVEIEGLWGIAFGAGGGGYTGPTNALFFAAGPDDEKHGLFGRIDVR